MKGRESKNWIFLLAMVLTLGVFGITYADAHSSYLSQYNTYFPGTGAGCGLCHVDSKGGGPLTSTGTTFANSGHNYASIKPTDTTLPTVTITTPTSSPAYTASSSSLSIGGTVSDNFTGSFGVTQVSWSNAAGAGNSGTATGTTSWSATIPLSSGSNVITVTAKDYSGNIGTAKLTVTHTQPDITVSTV